MAFLETRQERRLMSGACPVDVTLSEKVNKGDCIGISSATWVLSAHASGEQPLLVAGSAGASGETIKCYPMAILEVTTASANAATVGEVVALKDTGEYQADGAGLPDVGFVISATTTKATLCVCPLAPQLTTVRS